MQSPADLIERFRAEGRNVTPQRQAVFDALHGDESHPSADVIWDRVRVQMPTVSLRTVYQVLNDLVDLGEIHVVDVGDGPARFDPNVSGHDHFVCSTCRRVIDVHASAPAVLSAADYGMFEVEVAQIVFRGQCPQCVSEAESG